MLLGWLVFRNIFREQADAAWARRFFTAFVGVEVVLWTVMIVYVALLIAHGEL